MTKFPNRYDEANPYSIEEYAQDLVGLSFNDVLDNDRHSSLITEEQTIYAARHEDANRKGGLGDLIEERYFHYKCNNDSLPDFDKAGCELKVTPYKANRNGSLSAKERLVITMIDYMNAYKENFENSHLWSKCRLILLVYYLWLPNVNRLDYQINYAKLFSPPENDLKIIREDYNTILDKIKAGKAHELSGSDTLYLEACTKAATSADRRQQPFSKEPAKPRAFAFKVSYMTYVLNSYIVPGKTTYEPIITSDTDKSLEQYITDKMSKYFGWTQTELCHLFDIQTDKPIKNLGALLAYRILGIKGNQAAEFEKAGIVVKTIRIGKNNRIKESMSFPAFKFTELVKESWEDSTFRNYLADTKFFFVIYKEDKNNELRLVGCQFWSMPYDTLESDVKYVWNRTKDVLTEGLQVKVINGKNHNNLPKSTENPVCHVRPHGRDAQDVYELPTGGYYTKQCFWLNNSYILSQINPKFIN